MKIVLFLLCPCLLMAGGLLWQARTSKPLHTNVNLHVTIVLLAALLAMPLVRTLPGSVTDTTFGFLLTLGIAIAPFVFSAMATIALARQMLLEKSRYHLLALLTSIAAFIIHASQIRMNVG